MTKAIDEARARLKEIQGRCLIERDKIKGMRGATETEDRKAIRNLRKLAERLRRTLRRTGMDLDNLVAAMADVEEQYDATIGRREQEEIARFEAVLESACSLD